MTMISAIRVLCWGNLCSSSFFRKVPKTRCWGGAVWASWAQTGPQPSHNVPKPAQRAPPKKPVWAGWAQTGLQPSKRPQTGPTGPTGSPKKPVWVRLCKKKKFGAGLGPQEKAGSGLLPPVCERTDCPAKLYEIIENSATDATKPYKLIWSGDGRGPNLTHSWDLARRLFRKPAPQQ